MLSLERELETARAELSRSVGLRARFEQRRPSRSRREGALPRAGTPPLEPQCHHPTCGDVGLRQDCCRKCQLPGWSRTRLIRSAAVQNAGSAAGMAALGARGDLKSAACPPYCDAGSSAGRGLTWPAFCSSQRVAHHLHVHHLRAVRALACDKEARHDREPPPTRPQPQ